MIDLDLITPQQKITLIKDKDNFLSIEDLPNDQLETLRKNVILYIKYNSPIENIKLVIKESKKILLQYNDTIAFIDHQYLLMKKVGKRLKTKQFLAGVCFGLSMKGDFDIENFEENSNWEISTIFFEKIYDRLHHIQWILTTLIEGLEDFINVNDGPAKKDRSKFSNPEIAIAFSILYRTTKKGNYLLNEKNCPAILKKYSNGNESVVAFLRVLDQYKSLEFMKKLDKTNKPSATKRLKVLDNAKVLIEILDKKSASSKKLIDQVIDDYTINYQRTFFM